MKKLILATALAALLGAPAFAQSYSSSIGSGNIAPAITPNSPHGVWGYPVENQGHGAYAQATTGSIGATSRSRVPRALAEPNANVPEAW